MTQIHAGTELWGTSLLPEGMIETWLVPDGSFVEFGAPLVTLRIEGATHKLLSPAKGWLTIESTTNAVVDPGAVIGHVSPERGK